MKVEIRGLCKSYGRLQLYKDFNLVINESALTCLYGSSGCGKTTLLNIIGLIESYETGEIYYDGEKKVKAKDIRTQLRNQIGFIFQNFGLIENLTVLQNIRIVKKNQKLSEDKIDAALKEFGLEGFLHRKVYELSGGEQQRVALANVYLKNASLILADEPTASLDKENAKKVMDILRSFADAGRTVIIVSHDKEVREFCDYSHLLQ